MDKPLYLLLVSKEYPNMIRRTLRGLRQVKIKMLTRVNEKNSCKWSEEEDSLLVTIMQDSDNCLCIEPIPEERWLAFVWHQGTNSSSLSMCIARITVTVAKYISAKPQISRGLAELMHKHENSL